MDNSPLVSIITPTFNRADYLPLAINSVLKQTYNNYELIIIDDGSTDTTKNVVDSFLPNNRIIYNYQTNKGQSAARNSALKIASGKFICFLDSDNLYYPDKLEYQMNYLEQNLEIDIIYGDEDIIDQEGNLVTKNNMRRYSGKIYEKLLIDNFVSMNTVMMRRQCFDETGGFDESIIVADDYDLWLRFSVKYNFHYENKYFVKYRVMSDQISSDKSKRFSSNENTIIRFMNNNQDLISKKKIKYIMCRFYAREGRYYVTVGNRKKALLYIFKSLRCKILCMAPWRTLVKAILNRT